MARIAFLIKDMGAGGAERVALSLIQGFVRRGHEVDLVLMHNAGRFLAQVPPEVRLFDLKAPRVRNVVRPLGRYLKSRRPDALQVSMWPLPIAAIIAARIARVPTRIVLSEHSVLSREYGASKARMAMLRASTRLFYPRAHHRVAVSRGSARDLAALAGLSAARVTTVLNPIAAPPADFVADPKATAAWGGARFRILSVGALKAEKNQALLIRAFARLDPALDASLVILGEGAERARLEQLIDDLGVAERVKLPGFSDDLWSFYAAASLFVLSSDFEGFGNVLVEAMAAGLPVVSTDCDFGPAEILDGGAYGTLVPCGSEELLAQAMADALAKPRDPELLKSRARDFAEDVAVDRYLELLLNP